MLLVGEGRVTKKSGMLFTQRSITSLGKRSPGTAAPGPPGHLLEMQMPRSHLWLRATDSESGCNECPEEALTWDTVSPWGAYGLTGEDKVCEDKARACCKALDDLTWWWRPSMFLRLRGDRDHSQGQDAANAYRGEPQWGSIGRGDPASQR